MQMSVLHAYTQGDDDGDDNDDNDNKSFYCCRRCSLVASKGHKQLFLLRKIYYIYFNILKYLKKKLL